MGLGGRLFENAADILYSLQKLEDTFDTALHSVQKLKRYNGKVSKVRTTQQLVARNKWRMGKLWPSQQLLQL